MILASLKRDFFIRISSSIVVRKFYSKTPLISGGITKPFQLPAVGLSANSNRTAANRSKLQPG